MPDRDDDKRCAPASPILPAAGERTALRIEHGENATGMSMGTWVYRDDVLVWSHVGSEGPMEHGAAGLLRAIFGPDAAPCPGWVRYEHGKEPVFHSTHDGPCDLDASGRTEGTTP